jgi:trehalose 6-phosphate synthase/phosphatase
MSKLIIVSNRLPLNISVENDELTVSHSSGGLATGMSSIHNQGGSLWVGWSGIEGKVGFTLKEENSQRISE